MKKLKIGLISLGCEKNLVDSEMILGLFNSLDVEVVSDFASANAIIINTCGFIESAKKEAIDTIFEMLKYQELGIKIIVTGCLAQRYIDDLKQSIPDVDLYIPIKDYNRFGDLVMTLFDDEKFKNKKLSFHNRLLSTPKHLAYLKISEGCNNCCAYCAIPLIRGSFVSREMDDIILEFKYLVKMGKKEICLISQDLTKYGSDMDGITLVTLLNELVKVEGDYVIRLLYLYPDEITDELITFVKENDKVLNYFDIPIQHASNKVLKWMGRRGDNKFISSLILKIKKEIPDVILRTTIMVGFPHESDKDFKILLNFIEENHFDHLGAFTYSKEENTKSFNMTCQVSERIKQHRLEQLMEAQKWISYNENKKYINKTFKCVIESYDEENDQYLARGYMHAPDDIDGGIIIKSSKKLLISEFYNVKITDVDFYDIFGIITD